MQDPRVPSLPSAIDDYWKDSRSSQAVVLKTLRVCNCSDPAKLLCVAAEEAKCLSLQSVRGPHALTYKPQAK